MSASTAICVMTADDHPLLREGIATVIHEQKDMRLVAEATTGREAIEYYRRYRPDVTLMDLRMQDMSGIDAIRAIRAEFPAARIVILTSFGGGASALDALKAGAAGYVLKTMLRRELLDTIRLIHAGGKRVPPEIATEIAEHVTEEALTEREIEVLRGVMAGNSNKRIASQLAITEGTVKAHLKRILPKLGAQDRTHAVTIALKRGLLKI